MSNIKSILLGASLLGASVVRSTDDDLLGGLGLGDDAAATTETTTAGAAEDAKADRTEVKIGELKAVTFDSIPALTRGGGGSTGSKYKFEDIAAPVDNGNGGFSYSGTLVELVEGEVEDKLKRSVQSATTQENAKAKKAGRPERYLTRQHVVNGEFAGVYIIRVDGTQEEEAGEEAQA